MAAFDRILSGIPEMDTAFDNIRLGDNVVWRVSELSQFKLFMEPYIEQAIKDKRNIIYFRFASHESLVEDRPEIKTVEIPCLTGSRLLRSISTMSSKKRALMHSMFSTACQNFRQHGRQTS